MQKQKPKQKNKQKTTPRHIIFKQQKIKDKKKILKVVKGEKCLSSREANIRITSEFSQESCKQEDSRVKYLKC